MRIHCIQHVPFEQPAEIKTWADKNNFEFTYSHLYQSPALPDKNEIDALVIMGGPMSINEEDKYPWLVEEKKFIKECIDANKKVVGVCLGAQFIANVLGSKIYKNEFKEIGWLPIKFNKNFEVLASDYKEGSNLTVFHWHGETFDLPSGAVHLAESEGCKNQAFMFNKNVLALQFHLETNSESLSMMLNNCKEDMTEGKYVQSEEEIVKYAELNSQANQKLLKSLLCKLFQIN